MMAMYYRGKGYDRDDSKLPLDKKMVMVLWGFAKPFRRWLLLALLIMLLGTGADLLRPYLLKIAIDEQIAHRDMTGLFRTAWFYLGTIAASFILSYAQSVLLQFIGQRIIYSIRHKVFEQLIYQRYTGLETQPVGRMVTRVTNDTDAIRDLYTDVLVAFASDILVLIGIILVMLLINWQLALVSLAVLPVMLGLSVLYQRFARRAYRLVREKTAGLNTYIQESLNGISVIKSFACFDRTENEYRTVSDEYLAAGLQEMRTFAVFRPLVDLVYTLAVVLILWYSEWQIASGIEAGVVVAFLRYLEKFFWPIKDLAEKYSLLQSALAATERVWGLISSDEPDEKAAHTVTQHYNGEIRFENVWFAYEEPHWVLQDVSFRILPGQFIGIAGLSGSGKTTLISLLLRFYKPQRGRIYLDGTDIQMIEAETLRKAIGVVFQDVHLFKGTMADNIRLYNPHITQKEVEEAAQIANIYQAIMTMPQGFVTPVGYQGALLSMGERQLLSLARALAAKTSVLVLDEATSSIDSETEACIQRSLERIVGHRTMIVVAHRLSTIQKADKIVVMHKGKVVEEGTHDELIEQSGIYQRIYNSQ